MAHKLNVRGKIGLGFGPEKVAADKIKAERQLTVERYFFHLALFQLPWAVWSAEANVVWKTSDHLFRIDSYSCDGHLQ